MKNIFKAFVIMAFTFALIIPMQINVKASAFVNIGTIEDVAINKTWTVKFNKPLSVATVNTDNIKVLGESNKNIDIKVSLENGNKSIIVEPIKYYECNKTYTLIVTPNVKSEGGSPLEKEVRQDFKIGNFQQDNTKFIVCINAGRGGSDIGTTGPTGLKEKDVNLDIALRLGKLLEKENVQVVYTRTDDAITWDSNNEFQERMNIANRANSDLLITISCNSEKEAINGIETYYLKDNDKSKEFAKYIQAHLINQTGAANRGVRESELTSLKLSNAPGVMAAVGFLSNNIEEGKLKTSEYKDKLALAFAEGVKQYKNANPKSGNTGGNTDIPSGDVYIKDITENINKGDKYSLPSKFKIITSNGLEKKVDVVWDIKSLDTNIVGTYTFKGTIKESNKIINLLINVIDPTKCKYKVVLDAGHGGHDSGAVGVTGVMEKHVALAITLKVGNILTKNGVETVYTRTSDNITWSRIEKLNLQARCDISNAAKPNCFVSIHANSFENPAANGIETYYTNGNAASVNLAQAVQTSLINATGRYDRKIRTANYYVLNNTDATAILVETGFISNPTEANLLASEDYQNKVANAIANGILKSLGLI